jgi:hypothetical protein
LRRGRRSGSGDEARFERYGLYPWSLQFRAKESLVGLRHLDAYLPGLSGIMADPYYFAASCLVFVLE